VNPSTDSEGLRWAIDDLAYHQARVLLLIDAVSSEASHARKLDGLTKLAKLDFLIRYPALAHVVLDDLESHDQGMSLSIEDHDAPTEVEDPMTRYKFGPWDDRYYPVLGALVARGLIRYARGRRGSVALVPTPAGKTVAEALASDPYWSPVARRCVAVAKASAGLSGNALKERIYARLASLMDRPHREVIR